MKIFNLFAIAIIFTSSLQAQGPSKRYDFAKSYFGVDGILTPKYGSSAFLKGDGSKQDFTREGFFTPAINIGATHFWGFTDIYISIPIRNIAFRSQEIETSSDYGVFTGIRLYPLQLTDQKLRPFIGCKFSPLYYEQGTLSNQNASLTKVKSVLDIGIGYRMPKAYIHIAYNRVLNPGLEIPIARDIKTSTSFPKGFFNIGVNWMIETTRTSQNETFKKLNEYFGNTSKYGWFVAIGPSSAFPVVRSNYIQESKNFLDDLAMPAIFPDMALGYHFSKQELTAAFSYRPLSQFRGALDFQQALKRKSYLLEAYKFLGDYHGFNPFIGGGISYERLSLREADAKTLVRDEDQSLFTPVLTFGWDIRPAKKHDIWLLRTNLRYAPLLNFKADDLDLSLQHIEFNFIQVVIYPQRIMQMRRMRKN